MEPKTQPFKSTGNADFKGAKEIRPLGAELRRETGFLGCVVLTMGSWLRIWSEHGSPRQRSLLSVIKCSWRIRRGLALSLGRMLSGLRPSDRHPHFPPDCAQTAHPQQRSLGQPGWEVAAPKNHTGGRSKRGLPPAQPHAVRQISCPGLDFHADQPCWPVFSILEDNTASAGHVEELHNWDFGRWRMSRSVFKPEHREQELDRKVGKDSACRGPAPLATAEPILLRAWDS